MVFGDFRVERLIESFDIGESFNGVKGEKVVEGTAEAVIVRNRFNQVPVTGRNKKKIAWLQLDSEEREELSHWMWLPVLFMRHG